MIVRKVLFIVASTIPLCCSTPASVADQPNIVIIMADDLGYGDVQTLNDKSRIATPHLNRFAGEGVSFLDAHSPSAVCTPTRYSLLTESVDLAKDPGVAGSLARSTNQQAPCGN